MEGQGPKRQILHRQSKDLVFNYLKRKAENGGLEHDVV
jgi:hypothetical protein